MTNWWTCLLCGRFCVSEEILHSHLVNNPLWVDPTNINPGHGIREDLWEDYTIHSDLKIDWKFVAEYMTKDDSA